MPAAAVIPAPIAYAKIAVVEKLVVGFRGGKEGEVLFFVEQGLPFFPRDVW